MEPKSDVINRVGVEPFGSILGHNDDARTKETNTHAGCCVQESVTLKNVVLRLTTVPGATRDFSIEQHTVNTEEQTDSEPFFVEVDAPPGADAVLHLIGLPGRLGGDLVTLRLWSTARAAPVATVQRPLNKNTPFPLGRPLAPGAYEVAFSAGEQLLFQGTFHAPCLRQTGGERGPNWSRCEAAFYRPYRPHIDE